ncbi:MAG: hypothetical protein ABIG95_00145 [Candidatus Woesearchaeota archaeon]
MYPEYHLVVSLILMVAYYYFTGSAFGSLAAFCGSFFIDIDHFFEFWDYKKRVVVNKEFFRNKYYKKKGKIYVVFHSYELIAAVFAIFWVLELAVVGTGIALGMGLHLLMDIINNGWSWKEYFLVYRLHKGFRNSKDL